MSDGWARFAHRFGQYYQNASLWSPPRVKTREWMFIPFGGAPPLRHKSFSDVGQVKSFLSQRAMHSCFYSTAYWKRPYELKMSDKLWQGADLIFDLDGDHLPGVTDRDFPGMLEVIQDQAWALWNDFLEPEFGFSEDYLQVTFSGHRGFHLHYRDPRLFHLDSEARRELVSHIRGEGVDVQGGLARYHDRNAKGWTQRIRDGMDAMIATLRAINRGDEGSSRELRRLEAALQSLQDREGNTSQRSATAIKRLAELMDHDNRVRRLKEGKFELLGNYQTLFLNLLKADASVVLGSAGETDEVVTIDVRRQIRWPTSLHGKSGMRVTEFPLARLDPDSSQSYNPLNEAFVLGMDEAHEVEWVVDDAVAQFGDRRLESTLGERFQIHESGATFLVLKGWAKLV
ncbi:MAG: DNA primase small subunit domain-containing protein [Candidatus Poseidoniales archaeon]